MALLNKIRVSIKDFFTVTKSAVSSQQTSVFMKMSWTRLSSPSSEDVFKMSSRRFYQDEYIRLTQTSSEDVLIKTNIFVLSYIFKTSSRRLRRLQDVFKMPWRRLGKTSSICLAKTSSRHLQHVFKTFRKRVNKNSLTW